MQIVRGWSGVDAHLRGASVAMGNFDGVHLGHRSVIDLARRDGAPLGIDLARRDGAPLGIVTFEPHPRQVFAPHAPPFRLMNAETRANRMARLGVEIVYELPFGPDLAELGAEAFAREVLAEGLGVSHVVVGADFCFGKGRSGNAAALRDLGAALGFDVTIAPLLGREDGTVSSTAIRRALTDGRPGDAAAMLGHWHRIDGAVLHGEKRGRDLGYPTANMSIDGLHPPRFGVYAVRAEVLSGPHRGVHDGAASIGVRPMFGENAANLETYLFDFAGDLYDAHMSVALIAFLRGEERFDSLAALTRQMERDCAQARAVLADAPPLSILGQAP